MNKLTMALGAAGVAAAVGATALIASPGHSSPAFRPNKPPSASATTATTGININAQDPQNRGPQSSIIAARIKARPALQHIPWSGNGIHVNLWNTFGNKDALLVWSTTLDMAQVQARYKAFLASYHDSGAGYLPAFVPLLQVTSDVAGYEKYRQGSINWTNTSGTAYVAQVKPYMTPSGWAKLASSVGNGYPGANWTTAHQRHYVIVPKVSECYLDANSMATSPEEILVACPMLDNVYTQASPTSPLVYANVTPNPAGFNRAGVQTPAVFYMGLVGNQWKIQSSETGIIAP